MDTGHHCINMCSIEFTNKGVDDQISTSFDETTKVDVIDSDDDSGEDK